MVSKLTSSVMAVDEDRSGKINLGLSVKFEGRSQKVIDYSRKTDRYWEFSQTTVALIKEYKVTRCQCLVGWIPHLSFVQEKFPEVMRHLEKNGNGELRFLRCALRVF